MGIWYREITRTWKLLLRGAKWKEDGCVVAFLFHVAEIPSYMLMEVMALLLANIRRGT